MFNKIYPRDLVTNKIECSKSLNIRNLEIDYSINLVQLYSDPHAVDVKAMIEKVPRDINQNTNSLWDKVGISLYCQDYRYYYHLTFNKQLLKKDNFELIEITPIMENI